MHVLKAAGLVAAQLITAGSLSTVVLFTLLAAAQLILDDTIFACPCDPDLAQVYSATFLLVPAIVLFLADLPWKIVSDCPPPGVLCSMSRRPLALFSTWIVLSCLNRKYVDCLLSDDSNHPCVEHNNHVVALQMSALIFWLVVVIVAIVFAVFRRRIPKCKDTRHTMIRLLAEQQLKENAVRVTLEKELRWGKTFPGSEEEVSFQSLQALEEGINEKTYAALQSGDLLKGRLLALLRDTDLECLDVSVAQRCVLRSLLAKLKDNPEILGDDKSKRHLGVMNASFSSPNAGQNP